MVYRVRWLDVSIAYGHSFVVARGFQKHFSVPKGKRLCIKSAPDKYFANRPDEWPTAPETTAASSSSSSSASPVVLAVPVEPTDAVQPTTQATKDNEEEVMNEFGISKEDEEAMGEMGFGSLDEM